MTEQKNKSLALVQNLNVFFERILSNNPKTAAEEKFWNIVNQSVQPNPWFTQSEIKRALQALVYMLEPEKAEKWLSRYSLPAKKPSKVAVIMPGNIPMAGFHDFLCVLVSGNIVLAKTSIDDNELLPALADVITEWDSYWENRIRFIEAKPEGFDKVIATGSNNSARYFLYYFGKYPHIIRKNRNSVAVLDGNESGDELLGLCDDIFSYFGLGCRSISKLFVPEMWSPESLRAYVGKYDSLLMHSRYMNNYTYNKAIFEMHAYQITDMGNVLFLARTELVSPISVVYYEHYSSAEDLTQKLTPLSDSLQCIAGNIPDICNVGFGNCQLPEIYDYADGIDTMDFLLQ